MGTITAPVCATISQNYRKIKMLEIFKNETKTNVNTLLRKNGLYFTYHNIDTFRNGNHVIFTDENKFNFDGSNDYNYFFHGIRIKEINLSYCPNANGSVMTELSAQV